MIAGAPRKVRPGTMNPAGPCRCAGCRDDDAARSLADLLDSGCGAVPAAWFAVRAVEQSPVRGRAGPGPARVRRAAVRRGAGAAGPAGPAPARDGRGRVPAGRLREAPGPRRSRAGGVGPRPGRGQQGPVAALSRARLALETRPLPARRDLPRRPQGCGRRGRRGGVAAPGMALLDDRPARRAPERHAPGAGAAADPSPTLRTLWSTDYDHYPLESIGQALAKAHQAAPDDDRVWLALADLATRKGRLEEAGDWLARCERARPDDPAVWSPGSNGPRPPAGPTRSRGRRATCRPRPYPGASCSRCGPGLPARNGDRGAERAALERAHRAWSRRAAAAFERLADLAAQDGDVDRVAELRRRKAAAEAALRPLPRADQRGRLAAARGRARPRRRGDAAGGSTQRPGGGSRPGATRPSPPRPPPRWPGWPRPTRRPSPTGRSLADLLGPIGPREAEKTAVAGGFAMPRFADEAARRGLAFIFDNGRTDAAPAPRDDERRRGRARFRRRWLARHLRRPRRTVPPAPDGPLPFGDRLFRNRGDGTFEDVTASSGLAGAARRLRPRRGRGRLRQRRPPRPVRDPMAVLRPLSQPRRRPVRGRHGAGGARRRPRLADLGGLGRPRQRRRPRPVCLPLFEMGRRESRRSASKPGRPEAEHVYCDPRTFAVAAGPSSSATTAAGSST